MTQRKFLKHDIKEFLDDNDIQYEILYVVKHDSYYYDYFISVFLNKGAIDINLLLPKHKDVSYVINHIKEEINILKLIGDI